MEQALGERFARALAAKDAAALLDLLSPEVDFKAMTPGRFWEAASAREVVDEVLLGQWLEPDDAVEGVDGVETGSVGDRERVGYRFRVTNPSGRYVVEQQAYYDADGDRIGWLRVMCSGFRPA